MNKNTAFKMAEIGAEQSNYLCSMSFNEMIKKQQEYDKKNGREPMTLEQINQCIDEVRNQ